MKLKYLGTAAAEGIPGLFCQCEVCKNAREVGGKEIRTRSQALINDDLLIDFPPDTYMHVLKYNLDLANICHCLITHAHADHLYAKDFAMRRVSFAHREKDKIMTVYGSKPVGNELINLIFNSDLEKKNAVRFELIEEAVSFSFLDYTVTPLKAVHAPAMGSFIYLISQKGKTLLYAHDTDYFCDEVWNYIKDNDVHLDIVSLDCTEAQKEMKYSGHMNLEKNLMVKNRLIELGATEDKTLFVLNHFSHNGGHVKYSEFSEIAQRQGFVVAYDGMEITI